MNEVDLRRIGVQKEKVLRPWHFFDGRRKEVAMGIGVVGKEEEPEGADGVVEGFGVVGVVIGEAERVFSVREHCLHGLKEVHALIAFFNDIKVAFGVSLLVSHGCCSFSFIVSLF